MADRLVALGFTRVGERSAVLPGEQRRFEWNLVDDTTTIFFSIVPVRTLPGVTLVAFYSAFADGSFVVTTFPSGATVQRRDFDAAPGGSTPEETVVLHRRRVAAFAQHHGAPLLNRTMADLLQRDDTYRRRHGGATLRTRVYRFVGLTAVVVVATGAELLRVIVLDG